MVRLLDPARREGLGLLESLPESLPEDLGGHHDLGATQRRVALHLLGLHVDELRHEVGVGAGGREERWARSIPTGRRPRRAARSARRGRRGARGRTAGPPPSRWARRARPPGGEVRRRDRTDLVGDRVRRIRRPRPHGLTRTAGWRVEREPSPVGEVHAPLPASCGGQAGSLCHRFDPVWKIHASGNGVPQRPLRWQAKNCACTSSGRTSRSGCRRAIRPSLSPSASRHVRWAHGPWTRKFHPCASFRSIAAQRHRPAPVLLVEGDPDVQGRRGACGGSTDPRSSSRRRSWGARRCRSTWGTGRGSGGRRRSRGARARGTSRRGRAGRTGSR